MHKSTGKRWAIYCGMFAATCLLMLIRIAMLESGTESGLPFHSANDRSRWLTILALGDFNTYEIDRVIDRRTHWDSIDKVRHIGVGAGADRDYHYYSSKPTLLPTLMTYEYKLLKLFGFSIKKNPRAVSWTLLITFNVMPILITCLLLTLLADRYVENEWARIYIVACVCFGTYLTTFAITLNNHVPAALGSAVAIYALIGIWIENNRSWWLYFLAGLGAAWAGSNELPAISLIAVALTATAIKSFPKALIATLPGVLLIAIPSVVTNYIAHGTWVPPYAHRKDGDVVLQLDKAIENDLDAAVINWSPDSGPIAIPESLRTAIVENSDGIERPFSDFTGVKPGRTPLYKDIVKRWVVLDDLDQRQYAITKTTDGDLQLRHWDNWYEYEGSYWLNGVRKGVDTGNPSVLDYSLHCLVGHHGVFSLTPIWTLSLIGMLMTLIRFKHRFALIVFAIAVVTVVVVGFYLARPQIDRNYGGVTSTLRWLLWLAPLWLVCMIAAADRMLSGKMTRIVAIILLAISAASSLYAWSNPWQHPWLHQLLVYLKLINPF